MRGKIESSAGRMAGVAWESALRLARAGLAVSVLTVVALVSAPAGEAAAIEGPQRVAVPSYFYPDYSQPGSLWDRMDRSSPAVGMAVINPASGPGAAPNPDYAAQVARSRAAGLTVIGYVHTGYGARDAATVKAEIDRYYEWYGVDGIFLDEADNRDCALATTYYKDLFDHVKAKGGRALVAINPGAQVAECYMGVADVVVNFEGYHSTYVENYSAPAWVADYAPGRFWHLIHGSPDAEVERTVNLSKQRNAGWVFVTPDVLPNPWDTLPPEPYWAAELSAVGATPPAAPTLDLDPASDSGFSATDDLTNEATPVLVGNAAPNVTVEVREGTELLGVAGSGDTGAWSLAVGPLADGAHDLSATTRDAAGNASYASEVLTVTVDTQAPAVSGVAPVAGSNTVAAGANVGAVFSEEIDATSLNADTFTLTRAGAAAPVPATVAYNPVNERAVLNPSSALAPGATYVANVEGGPDGARDAAGNPLAAARTWSFSVNSPPVVTNLAPAPGSTIGDNTPTIAATVRDAQTDLSKAHITLYVDGNPVGDAAYAYDRSTNRLTYTSSRGEGRHPVRVVATDAQGLTEVEGWAFTIV